MIIGYTSGVFDLFHVGHLRLLQQAKKNCDYLIVAVTTDELAEKLKGRKPVIPYCQRKEILKGLTCVDKVISERIDDKIEMHRRFKFNIIFKGNDWKGTDKWNELEEKFKAKQVKVKYFNYTKKISSSLLIRRVKNEY